MGSMDKEQSFKLLDAFVDAGGNFIDTANNYQDDDSETWVGEWMKERKNRDQIVVATKYTTNFASYHLGKSSKAINHGGNSRKSLHISLRESLRKLQTDYIDILYVP
jgi:aryl-alcohol dehydrogenase-like predicted oxidoreductase